eukprot:6213726-Pleurochrysis_carterae.AAC.3
MRQSHRKYFLLPTTCNVARPVRPPAARGIHLRKLHDFRLPTSDDLQLSLMEIKRGERLSFSGDPLPATVTFRHSVSSDSSDPAERARQLAYP